MLRYESLAVSALQLMKLPHCCEPLRVASSIHLTSQSLTFLESRQSQLVFPSPEALLGGVFLCNYSDACYHTSAKKDFYMPLHRDT